MFVLPRIIFPRGGNNRQKFLEESVETRLLEAKGNEEYIPKNKPSSPVENVPLHVIWDKVFKNEPNEICRIQSLKNLKGLKQFILEFLVHS